MSAGIALSVAADTLRFAVDPLGVAARLILDVSNAVGLAPPCADDAEKLIRALYEGEEVFVAAPAADTAAAVASVSRALTRATVYAALSDAYPAAVSDIAEAATGASELSPVFRGRTGDGAVWRFEVSRWSCPTGEGFYVSQVTRE